MHDRHIFFFRCASQDANQQFFLRAFTVCGQKKRSILQPIVQMDASLCLCPFLSHFTVSHSQVGTKSDDTTLCAACYAINFCTMMMMMRIFSHIIFKSAVFAGLFFVIYCNSKISSIANESTIFHHHHR